MDQDNNPRARSALISCGDSRPTAIRNNPPVIPAASRASWLIRPCVVVAGWVNVLLVSPRLAVIEINLALSMTRHAASFPPSTSKVTMPPPPAVC